MQPITLRRVARAYLVSVGIWCSLSVLTGWQFLIFDRGLSIHSSFLQMIVWAEARGFAYALLTPPIFYFVRRYAAGVKHWGQYVGAFVAGLPPFMVLYAWIHWLVVPPWDPGLQRFVPRAGHSPLELIWSGFADQITMYVAIVVAAHAYLYFDRARKLEIEQYEYQQALAASELQSLKMQLHPHFLFNTLHGISTLIDSDRDTAKAMVIKLSTLLRVALKHSGSDLIPFQEELKFIGEYLDLEKMRFGKRLDIAWSVAPDTMQLLVPQLILQPLVENAIRHGIASSREAGWVEISSQINNETFELRVRNRIGGNRSEGAGVGLRNTRVRLRHLYGGEATLSFVIGEDQAATATLRFPAFGSISHELEQPRNFGQRQNGGVATEVCVGEPREDNYAGIDRGR